MTQNRQGGAAHAHAQTHKCKHTHKHTHAHAHTCLANTLGTVNTYVRSQARPTSRWLLQLHQPSHVLCKWPSSWQQGTAARSRAPVQGTEADLPAQGLTSNMRFDSSSSKDFSSGVGVLAGRAGTGSTE